VNVNNSNLLPSSTTVSIDISSRTCPVTKVINVISKRWTVFILYFLESHPEGIRFNDLHKKLNHVSPRTLSARLKELEAYKLIKRIQYEEIPPRVEYYLSDLGLELQRKLQIIHEWAREKNFGLEE
jgi:DNA-binding HxlR family transcriptional regulator